MVSMVIKSFSFNSQLVQDDYYQLDLDYEDFRQKRENATLLKDQFVIKPDTKTREIYLQFPTWMSTVNGEVRLYRPSNQYLDKSYSIKVSESNDTTIKLDSALQSGLWNIHVDWKDQEKGYYYESTLYL